MSLLFSCWVVGNAQALLVDPFNTDLGKVGNKISATAQEAKLFFERTVEEIRGSQFAMVIGQGISSAQQAKDWIKDVQELKETVLSSAEYKIIQKTKEVGIATKELNDIMKEKKSKVKEIRDNELLEVGIWEEKIALAKNNKQIGAELYKTSETKSEDSPIDDEPNNENDEESELTEETDNEFEDVMDAEISSYEEEIEGIHLLAEDNVAATESEYDDKIKEQAEVIKELEEELAELIKQNKDKIKKERIKATKEALIGLAAGVGAIFMFKKGEEKTVSDVERKRKAATKEVAKSSIDVVNNAVTNTSTGGDNKYTAENVELTQDAQSGKSEVIQMSVEETIKQAELVRNYLLIELKNLKLQIDTELKFRASEAADDAVVDIDICDYEVYQVEDYGKEKGKSSNSANTNTGME